MITQLHNYTTTRKYKLLLSCLTLLLMSNTIIFAQFNRDDGGFDCGGGIPPEITCPRSGSIDPAVFDTLQPKVFNVKFWQINDAQGQYNGINGEIELLETKQVALATIATLNKAFNEHKIFFKYRGVAMFDSPDDVIHKINDPITNMCEEVIINGSNIDPDGWSTISICQTQNMYGYAEDNGYYDENAFNLYVPYGTTDFGGTSFGLGQTVFRRGALDNVGMVHEMGHQFGLRHTWQGWDVVPLEDVRPDQDGCEHVTRNPADDNFNALEKGDNIPDTAAVPDFRLEYCYFDDEDYSLCRTNENFQFYYLDEDCGYDSFNFDCEGTFYDIESNDVQNYMGYTRIDCYNQFTLGQAIYMHETVCGNLDFKELTTSIEALYEPYEGEYYGAGPYYPNEHTPLFQPGFDYVFVRCEGNYVQPAPFGEAFSAYPQNRIKEVSRDETNFSTIFHPNHTAIIIDQVDSAFDYARVEKCYDNYNRNPLAGRVVRFNDNVLNTNITITEKDSTGINNEQLIDNLSNGLYKIEKDYPEGVQTQTILFKDNQ